MKKYIRRDDIMAADMNGETVMMDIVSGKYFNIGETGGAIWRLLEKKLSRTELAQKLSEEYRVSAEQCAEDIRPFLQQMTELGLIVCTDE